MQLPDAKIDWQFNSGSMKPKNAYVLLFPYEMNRTRAGSRIFG